MSIKINTNINIKHLPGYQHQDLGASFLPLNNAILDMLNQVTPKRPESIKLKRTNPSLYAIDNIASAILNQNDFFLAVYFPATDTNWTGQFIRQIKVGALAVIEDLITLALSGVKLTYMQRPPNKLGIKPGYEYFYLDPSGAFWEPFWYWP